MCEVHRCATYQYILSGVTASNKFRVRLAKKHHIVPFVGQTFKMDFFKYIDTLFSVLQFFMINRYLFIARASAVYDESGIFEYGLGIWIFYGVNNMLPGFSGV